MCTYIHTYIHKMEYSCIHTYVYAAGKLTLDREVSTRKKILKEEVKVRSEMLSAQQIKLKKAKEELKRVCMYVCMYVWGVCMII